MATSASDRLKAMLAAQLNKKANNENQPANQATQPQVSNSEAHNNSQSVCVDNSVVLETGGKTEEKPVESNSVAVIESDQRQIVLAQTSVPTEAQVDPAKSAFFDTPLGRMMNDLETALDAKLPGMPSILRDIHLHMQKDVDCVTKLSDEEIGTIVRGLESVQGQTIVANPKTGRSTGGKKAPVVASML